MLSQVCRLGLLTCTSELSRSTLICRMAVSCCIRRLILSFVVGMRFHMARHPPSWRADQRFDRPPAAARHCPRAESPTPYPVAIALATPGRSGVSPRCMASAVLVFYKERQLGCSFVFCYEGGGRLCAPRRGRRFISNGRVNNNYNGIMGLRLIFVPGLL